MIRPLRPAHACRGGVVVACFFAVLVLPLAVHADTPSVVMNEVLYDAVGSDTGQEWIELFNAGSGDVLLDGWRIERGGTSFASVFTFPSNTHLAPGAFLLVGEAAVPHADFTATLVFQNGGDATDGIRLLNAHGDVVDVVLYDAPNSNGLPDERGSSGTSFAPDVAEGHSLARVSDGADTHASETDFRDARVPTPRQSNSTLSATPTPEASSPTPGNNAAIAEGALVVNEVLPDPVGDDAAGEFVELHNLSAQTIALDGLRLDDADGGSTAYVIPSGTTIAAGGYRSFPRSETKLAFNNDGDTARLLTADGAVMHATTYEDVPREGAAWARRNTAYEWTLSPTGGSANSFTPLPTPTPKATAGSASSPRASAQSARASVSPTPTGSALSTTREASSGSAIQKEGNTGSVAGKSTAQAARQRRAANSDGRMEEEQPEETAQEASASPTPTIAGASSRRMFLSTPALLAWVGAGVLGAVRLFSRRG